MGATTDQEWEDIKEALVRGGLRETIDRILLTRIHTPEVSAANRKMLSDVYGGGVERFVLTTMDQYFAGHLGRNLIVEGVEVKGLLYTLRHNDDGTVRVMVGDNVSKDVGRTFPSVREAWDAVKDFTAL